MKALVNRAKIYYIYDTFGKWEAEVLQTPYDCVRFTEVSPIMKPLIGFIFLQFCGILNIEGV